MLDIWCYVVDVMYYFLSDDDCCLIEFEVVVFLFGVLFDLVVDEIDCLIGFMLFDGSYMEVLFVDFGYYGVGVGWWLVEEVFKCYFDLLIDVNE